MFAAVFTYCAGQRRRRILSLFHFGAIGRGKEAKSPSKERHELILATSAQKHCRAVMRDFIDATHWTCKLFATA